MADTSTTTFTENCPEAGCRLGWDIHARLERVESAYQTIEIYHTTHWGNLMVIDDCVMLTSRDNFLYHEMMAHPALVTHPDPARVLIIGGGDCGTLSEVLKHDAVKICTQVDIDEQVTRLSERYFPELCERNRDSRAELHFADGIAYVRGLPADSMDVIIIDSTDPIGPAEGLFGPEFILDCRRALAEPGVLVQQSESPLLHSHLIRGIRDNLHRAGFDAIRTLGFPQPCYPSGWWSATLGTVGCEPEAFRVPENPPDYRYYSPETHRGALTMPAFLVEAIGADDPSTGAA